MAFEDILLWLPYNARLTFSRGVRHFEQTWCSQFPIYLTAMCITSDLSDAQSNSDCGS